MPLMINTNVSSLTAQRYLGNNTTSLQKTMEKLASGYRINRAGDDAAGLQILLFIITGSLVPIPAVFLLRLSKLSRPLDWLHQWMMRMVLEGASPDSEGWRNLSVPLRDAYAQFYDELQRNIAPFSASITDSVLVSLIMSLMLPLGTFAFTLLYQDIRKETR